MGIMVTNSLRSTNSNSWSIKGRHFIFTGIWMTIIMVAKNFNVLKKC